MSLNHQNSPGNLKRGHQKYAQNSNKSEKSSKSKETAKAGELAPEGSDPKKKKQVASGATVAPVSKGKIVVPPVPSISKKSAADKAAAAKEASSKETQAASGEISEAIEEKVTAEESAREEAEIQKEIAEELALEAATTSKLVREEFSPVNSPRDRLVTEYAPLIKYIAQKIAARLPANIELDDLMSSGVIGLMDAIEKYDATRDNKFKTYAEFRIRGAILDELRAQDWVPRSVREKAKVLERCYAKIEHSKGRHATDEEVCAELNISQNEYHDLLNQVRSVSLLSFDDVSSFSKADKRALHGYGEGSSRAPTPFNEINVAAVKRMVSDAIHDLPEKQRLVLSLYYYEDLNLKEIGRVLDVTESRVSQLHTQAIIRLKGKLRGYWDEFLTLMA